MKLGENLLNHRLVYCVHNGIIRKYFDVDSVYISTNTKLVSKNDFESDYVYNTHKEAIYCSMLWNLSKGAKLFNYSKNNSHYDYCLQRLSTEHPELTI